MKALKLIAFLLMAISAQAQTVRWEYVSKSIAVNDADTVYFAFRSAGYFDVDASTSAIDPPDEVYNDDASIVTIRETSGGAAGSVIAYAKGLDAAGRIVQNDLTFLFGTSYAAPVSANKFGDGRVHSASLAGLLGKYNGVMLVCKMFDLVGGARTFEFGHGRN